MPHKVVDIIAQTLIDELTQNDEIKKFAEKTTILEDVAHLIRIIDMDGFYDRGIIKDGLTALLVDLENRKMQKNK